MNMKKIKEINKEVDKINSNDELNKTEKLFHLLILKNELYNCNRERINRKRFNLLMN